MYYVSLSLNTVYLIDLASSRSQSVIHCHAVIFRYITQLLEETNTITLFALDCKHRTEHRAEPFLKTELCFTSNSLSKLRHCCSDKPIRPYLYGKAGALKKWEFPKGSSIPGTHLKLWRWCSAYHLWHDRSKCSAVSSLCHNVGRWGSIQPIKALHKIVEASIFNLKWWITICGIFEGNFGLGWKCQHLIPLNTANF